MIVTTSLAWYIIYLISITKSWTRDDAVPCLPAIFTNQIMRCATACIVPGKKQMATVGHLPLSETRTFITNVCCMKPAHFLRIYSKRMLCKHDCVKFCGSIAWHRSRFRPVVGGVSLQQHLLFKAQLKTHLFKVPFRVLQHFTHNASVMSVNAEANVHSTDWLSIFVNELAPPNVRSQQGQCVQQCRRIMKDTLVWFTSVFFFVFEYIHSKIQE